MRNIFSKTIAITASICVISSAAFAIPSLQLDIDGGLYDSSTETIVTTDDAFTLYAYLIPDANNILDDTYYISAAIAPATSSAASLGSFDFGGATVSVTGDMTYGTAPLESALGDQGWDAGDLQKHSIFPTYFWEHGFQFALGQSVAPYDTQDRAMNADPINISGSGMYYVSFAVDISGLDPGYDLHFDLYNTETLSTDTDICKSCFAPLSHDAQTVPEPGLLVLYLAGIVCLFCFRKKISAPMPLYRG